MMPLPGANTLPALLAQRAATTPNAVAFQHETSDGRWQAITWQSFHQQVEQIALALQASGLRKGDRLALIAPVSLRWELLHHAALRIGVVVVGLDAHDQPARLACIASQAGVCAIATSAPEVTASMSHQQLSGYCLRLLLAEPAATSSAGPAWLSWVDFSSMPTAPEPLEPVTEHDDATLIFTSGTTGAPKGIAYSHAQLRLAVDAICGAYSFVGEEGRLLCWLPLSNLFQRVVNLAALQQGAATYLLADPRRVMAVVGQVSPDIFIGVPRFFEKLNEGLLAQIASQPPLKRWLVQRAWALGRQARAMERSGQEPSTLLRLAHGLADQWVLRRVRGVMGKRLVCMVTGSAPMPKHLLEEFHALGWLILESYGLSENVLPMAMNTRENFRFGTVGRPVVGNEIVTDEGGGIKVRGPGLFRGYLDELADSALDAQGFYATGDIGELDDDGFLRLTGRNSDLIKTSTGRRVAPAGPEAVLRSVPGVEQALVVGDGRKCLVALCACSVAPADEAPWRLLLDALRDKLEQIAANDRPAAIGLIYAPFSIEAGELTTNLKLRRDAITRRYAELIEQLYALAEDPKQAQPKLLVRAAVPAAGG